MKRKGEKEKWGRRGGEFRESKREVERRTRG